MSKRFLITIFTLLVIGTAAAAAILLAKGYTFSTQQKKIVGTGIISITSTPDAASVYIDGHLTTATNATISSLPPGTYTVKVVKDGFISWERQVQVNQGLVTDLKITLFPAIPTIYPLTFNGVQTPVMSPDEGKLAFIVPTATDSAQQSSLRKTGVWVWTLQADQPISFARSSEPHQIAQNISVDYSKATLRWSSDSKQVLATVGNSNFLLNADGLNSDPIDITPTLRSTLDSWTSDQKNKDDAKIALIKDLSMRKIASDSAVLRWSPDETKFIYGAPTPGNGRSGQNSSQSVNSDQNLGLKVYDLTTNQQDDLPPALHHFWLPDSRHIVLVDANQISIVDFDGTNKAIIYAGNFNNDDVFAWPDSSKLMVVSSFPTPTASQPNLYGINLK